MSLAQIQEAPDKGVILLVGPPGAGKSAFCQQMVLNGLALDRPVIYVTTERGATDAIGLLRERGLGEPVPAVLRFVDAFSQTVGVAAPERPDTIQANCLDLNSISIATTRLQERMGQSGILLAFDSLTSPYLLSGAEVVRFTRLFLSRFVTEGNSVVALIDEGCGKPEDLVAMTSVADGIITMEMGEDWQIINVVKHPTARPTKIKTPTTPSGVRPGTIFDRELSKRVMESVVSGHGGPFRTEIGDYVNVFWRNLVSWSGMLWDPKRFPAMAYRLEKEIEFQGLRHGMALLPWHRRLLFQFFVPKSLSEPKAVKAFLARQGKPMKNRGMRITEYLEEPSGKDEHHIRVYENYNCWGLEQVGARLAFQDCGLLAGVFKALEKEERDWNAVETKCIGLGDPYCEYKLVAGEAAESRGFLQDIDNSIVERIHDRMMEQLVGFLVHGQPLVERPRLGSGLSFYLLHHVISIPSAFSERYRMALRMGGAKAGKEAGEHLVEAGVTGDEAIKRVINLIEYCKVAKVFLGDTIQMRENCEAFGVETGEPSCYFTTGFLNGFFSAVKNQHVRETRCIAMGDPYCEWEII